MTATKNMDPWGQVEDLYGNALYLALDLESSASKDDIKKAYRRLAKQYHPDKGGDPAIFSKIQHAYEVLNDTRRRLVYDTWAKELQFRYIRPSNNNQPLGGEDVLLDELDALGLHCDPGSQLVVTCEVCRRPATKECWTCGMQICEFCTLKRHWKDGVPLHWPLVNTSHMKEKLAKRELEKKRIDDANRLALENPNHRSARELQDIRSFRKIATEILQREDRYIYYDIRLARYYMWAQTPTSIYIACSIPTGYSDKELVVECTGSSLLIQPEDSPPIIERLLAYPIDSNSPLEIMKTEENRVCIVMLKKADVGEHWLNLFQGDSVGARCLQPPYTLTETDDEVIVELYLPFWIESRDVKVEITETDVDIKVENTMHIHRTMWRDSEEEQRRRDYSVIDVANCTWSLDDETDSQGERCKVLTLTLARPELTEEEIMWKKGRRQDNTTAQRPGAMHGVTGFRFFQDDEDWYELEDVLQAVCFVDCGVAFVPPKPWVKSSEHGVFVKGDARFLSGKARGIISQLLTVKGADGA